MNAYTKIIFGLLFFLLFPSVKSENVRERVYLQTDKQFYLAGELLWIKMISTDNEGKPQSFSKVGYIELLDDSTSVSQVKIELNNGTGQGCIELPATLPTGYYRLTGYTRYMRNEGEAVFFNKIVPVVNTFRTDGKWDIAEPQTGEPENIVREENTLLLSTNTQAYPVRTRGELSIKEIPDNIHTLSVSIAGKDLTVSNTPINLKVWKQSLPVSSTTFKNNILPEYEGHIVTGKIIDITNDRPTEAKGAIPILGFIGDQPRLFTGIQDTEGNVSYYTKRISGTHEVLTGVLSSFDNSCRVDIQSPFMTHSEKILPVLHFNPEWDNDLRRRSVGLQVLHSYLADTLSYFEAQSALFQWKPDRKYVLDEYTRFTTMEEVVIEFIPSLRFRKINGVRLLSVLLDEVNKFSSGNTLVLLDGIPILDHEVIFQYDPLLLKEIEVYKESFVFGKQHFGGIASFKSYKGDYPRLSLDATRNQIFTYEGTQLQRYFYSPSYETEEQRKSRLPDYRHTLLWEPDIRTEGASSLSVPFTTSELTGDYVITVEGLTKDGQPVFASTTIKIE